MPSKARYKERAGCRDEDTDLFFPAGHGSEFAHQIATAKAVCRSCPVRRDCLRDAVTRPEKYGIWGGLDERELAALRRNDRRRVRPRFSEKEGAA